MSVTGLRLVRRGKHLSQNSFIEKMQSSLASFEDNSSCFCQFGLVHLILFFNGVISLVWANALNYPTFLERLEYIFNC